MNLNAASPLKVLDLTDRPGVARASGGLIPTKLTPADLSGVISHKPKRATPAAASGINAARGPAGAAPASNRATQHEQLVKTTEQWVAQTFFGTMLKQMRNSPFKSDLFEGGRGGQAFGELYDQKLIEHMSRGAGRKIVNALVRRIESKADAAAAYNKQNLAGSAGVTPPATAAANARAGEDPGSDATNTPPREGQAAPSSRRPGPSNAAGGAVADLSNPYRNVRVHVAPAR